MTWNHRVIRHDDKPDDIYYAIHECFYEKEGSKIPTSWTMDPINVMGATREELVETLERMLGAVKNPILKIEGEKLGEVEPALTEGVKDAV